MPVVIMCHKTDGSGMAINPPIAVWGPMHESEADDLWVRRLGGVKVNEYCIEGGSDGNKMVLGSAYIVSNDKGVLSEVAVCHEMRTVPGTSHYDIIKNIK